MAKIIGQEESSDVPTPGTGNRALYPKSDGWYDRNDAGVVTGPFGTATGFITGSYTLLDGRYQPTGTASSGGGGSNSICDGRLTLVSATPVPTTNVSGTTIYFTPYIGNKIALYDGTSTWNVRTFSEISVAAPSIVTGTFDVFCYDNAGTPTLETVNWTNDTTRATGLVWQEGVLVKSGATTRRYLGTGRTTPTSGVVEDSLTKRFLWNHYHRVLRPLYRNEPTASWTYGASTWRQSRADVNNKVEFVIGYVLDKVGARFSTLVEGNNAGGGISIGLDRTNAIDANFANFYSVDAANLSPLAFYNAYVAVGYHYFASLERAGVGTPTYYGAEYFRLEAEIFG